MAYTVYNNDGSVLVNIPNGEVDDLTTSLSLVGKNVNNYGEILNNNFVKLLTNSADNTSPLSPQTGQLWFDKTTNKLKVFNGSGWEPPLQPTVDSVITGSPSQGDLWYDTSNSQFKIYVNNTWTVVGPSVNPNLGRFGIEPPKIPFIFNNDIGNNQNIGVLYSYGTPFMFLSSGTFTADVNATSYYLQNSTSTVNIGTTILNTLTVNRDVKVSGDIIVQGKTLTPYRGFTAAYNSGWIGAFTSTYTATNNFVRLELLPLLFSTASTVTNLLSEVKVVLTSGTFTATEVRHYRLEERVTGVRVWEAYEQYNKTSDYNTIVSTWTNVVRIS